MLAEAARKQALAETAGNTHIPALLSDHLRQADRLLTPDRPSKCRETWIMADLPAHYTSTGSELPVLLTKMPQIPAGSHTIILHSSSSDSALQSWDLMIERRALDAASHARFMGHTIISSVPPLSAWQMILIAISHLVFTTAHSCPAGSLVPATSTSQPPLPHCPTLS